MTVTRVVLIRLAPEHRSEERREAIAAAARRMFPDIPGVTGIEAGPCVTGDDDVALLVRFDDMASVEPYRVHPTHVSFVQEHVAPFQEALRAQNFELE